MGDTVSKSEWKNRRKKLDERMAKDDVASKDTDYISKRASPEYVSDLGKRMKDDANFKKTYSKELGYKDTKKISAQDDKPAAKKPTEKKKSPAKKIVTTKR